MLPVQNLETLRYAKMNESLDVTRLPGPPADRVQTSPTLKKSVGSRAVGQCGLRLANQSRSRPGLARPNC